MMILLAINRGVASPFGVSGLEIRLDLRLEQGRAPDAEMPPDRLEAKHPARGEEGNDLALGEVVREHAGAPPA